MLIKRRTEIKKGDFTFCPACLEDAVLVEVTRDNYFYGKCEECGCAVTVSRKVGVTLFRKEVV